MTRQGPDRGSVTVELVTITPLLIVLALAVVAFGRLTTARLDIDSAAANAARAASIARNPHAATTNATDTAAASLAEDGITCASLHTTVDTTTWAPGGAVAVTVTCDVDLTQLTGLALPATHTLVSRAVAVIDTHRATTP